MLTREQKLDYAKRNTAIFIEEWGIPIHKDKGNGELIRFSFPLFRRFGREDLTESQLFSLASLTINFIDAYYEKTTQFSEKWFDEEMKLLHLYVHTKASPNASQDERNLLFGKEIYQLFSEGGVLYEKNLFEMIDAILAFVSDGQSSWSNALLCMNHMFLSAFPMLEESFDINNRDDVDSQMEYLLKAFLFVSGTEITDQEFFESRIA